jgi:hypothetical protein
MRKKPFSDVSAKKSLESEESLEEKKETAFNLRETKF